jgi:hypothetical protein
VPEPLRSQLAPLMPWRTEPEVYRSDLGRRLPRGLSLPRAHLLAELGEESAAIWLDRVPVRRVRWDVAHHRHAAYLLGRFAARPSVAHLAAEVPIGRTARRFAEHWLAVNVVPDLTAEDLWRQPHVAATFDAHLRDRILRAATALPTLVDELESLTTATAHGDACTDNLLPRHPVDPLRAPDRWSGTRTAPTLREPRRHGPLRTRPPGRHDSAPRSPLSSPPSRHRR